MKFRYLAALAIIATLFLSGERFMSARFQLAGSIGEAVGFFTPNADLKAMIADLKLENADLRAKIFLDLITPKGTFKVYSTYPFNNSNEIAIAAGADLGVKDGDAVVAGSGLLVGKVKYAFNNYSIVTTIHDPSWEMAVRIGKAQVDGLFNGGNTLTIQLISGAATVAEGDEVVTSGAGIPYGLSVGYIKAVSLDITGHFKNAIVVPAVVLNDLKNVSIRHK